MKGYDFVIESRLNDKDVVDELGTSYEFILY